MNRDRGAYSLQPIIFWTRARRQCHMTTCLMKFAVGERNVAIRYSFFASGGVYEHSYHIHSAAFSVQ